MNNAQNESDIISPISSHLEPIKEVLSRDKIPNAEEWKKFVC